MGGMGRMRRKVNGQGGLVQLDFKPTLYLIHHRFVAAGIEFSLFEHHISQDYL